MAENKSKVELSTAWLEDDEDIVEEEETVGSGYTSDFIEGYGAYDVKIVMAKAVKPKDKKFEFIEIDYIDKDGRKLKDSFMVRGKDGKTFYVKNGKKIQHFGINRIKSLIAVTGALKDVEPKKYMATLYGNAEEADVTYEEYGKEKTEKFLTFPDLIGEKVKVCVTSKKVNAQWNREQDDSSDQKYVDACIKATKEFVKKNPKRKSLAKFADDDVQYVNTYRWFTESSSTHFCSLDGLFASELEDGKGELLQKFLDKEEEGTVYDMRTLKPEELSESQLSKLGINEYGKRVESDESDDDYEEPEAEEEDDEDEW